MASIYLKHKQMNTSITGKTCIDCKTPKLISEYYSARNGNHITFTTRCRKCHSALIAKTRREKSDYYKQKRAEYIAIPEKRELVNSYSKNWIKRNPEKVREMARVNYKMNRKKNLASAKKWREKNIDKLKAAQKKWYVKNRKRISKERKQYWRDNREMLLKRHRGYRLRNKMKLLQSQS